jgi:hypothetical protein
MQPCAISILNVAGGDGNDMATNVHPPKDDPVEAAEVRPATISIANNTEDDKVEAASVHVIMPSPIPCMIGVDV